MGKESVFLHHLRNIERASFLWLQKSTVSQEVSPDATSAEVGGQKVLNSLDSRFHGDDRNEYLLTSYESGNCGRTTFVYEVGWSQPPARTSLVLETRKQGCDVQLMVDRLVLVFDL
jgi:hypothetical protein